ncbi:MAG TPA: DUF3108 domain-containing protein [Gemmatimonadaceae bacterium]|nr:DUF3108 domain-containing protein [Gemmatimonadaceae bacterium]
MTRLARRAAALLLALAARAGAQTATSTAPAARAISAPAAVPLVVGERLDYDVRFGPLKVGRARMEVTGIDTVRGIDAWHTVFTVRGGTFFYRVNDVLESWIDTSHFASLRFHQHLAEGNRERDYRYEIFPDSARYVPLGKPSEPSVADPLDDASFLYFVRTLPLEVGKEYSFDRYFRPDRNPVRLIVLRRERVTVPAGTFDAIVVRPIIKTRGIFSEGGQAQIWLSDDARRMLLQLKSNLSFGSLNLYLTSYDTGKEPAHP